MTEDSGYGNSAVARSHPVLGGVWPREGVCAGKAVHCLVQECGGSSPGTHDGVGLGSDFREGPGWQPSNAHPFCTIEEEAPW